MKPPSPTISRSTALGHGGYQNLNYALATIQEAVDLVTKPLR